jgi:TolB protein
MQNHKIMTKYIITLTFYFLALTSRAESTIQITKGNIEPIAIAINNFSTTELDDSKLAKDIINVITNDLKGSGVFRPISPAAFIETKTGTGHTPLFAAWQQINAALVINGDVARTASGKIQVRFILWDSILESKMVSESYELPEKLWRRAAHKISDKIYSTITGNQGYFNTRIVYVSESGPYLKRVKRIALMDQDGANHQYLTTGSDLVLTPRFSPDGKKIIYLSYKNRIPQVHILDLRSGTSRLLGNFPGMSFSPRFSPDGNHAIMSIAKNGFTHIYEMNLKNNRVQQLTEGPSINTSPSYSPDGKKIAFNSDRNGARQIFIMDRLGKNIEKISFGGGVYAEPNWSSINLIAFTKISRDAGFTIGIMKPQPVEKQSTERLIANGYLVEAPSWANNGRVLVFTKGIRSRGKNTMGLNRIYTIDFTGYNERIIPTPGDASDPDWSNIID